ncbi:hypothetical protein BJY01DRAFT_255416 [Aspergillus pseudoustus]|uniref:Major facilitator superfamily domain-containing protein n=1 Tax=Aspergillus pseudoustus TaxID=1810923 RepID=A0ABR4IL55_9EURO
MGETLIHGSAATVLGPLISGGVLLVVFAVWESKGTQTGIVPHALFQHRNFAIAILIRFVGGIALFGSQTYFPQVIYQLFTTDGLQSAVWQLPFNGAGIVGGVLAAVIMRWTRDGKWVTVLILGGGPMYLVTPGVSFAVWFFPSALTGAAVEAESAILSIIVSLCTPSEMIATTIMFCSAVGSLGRAISIPIYGSGFNNKIQKFLPEKITKAVLDAGLPPSTIAPILQVLANNDQGGGTEAFLSVEAVTEQIAATLVLAKQQAYPDSFQYMWYLLLAFAAVATIFAVFLKSAKDQMTDEVVSAVQTGEDWKYRRSRKATVAP